MRAILEAAGRRPRIDDDLLVCGTDAVIIPAVRRSRPLFHTELNRAYLRFRASGAQRGVVISLGTVTAEDLRLRESLAPELVHAGPEAIQHMADAVAVGGDPFDFVRAGQLDVHQGRSGEAAG